MALKRKIGVGPCPACKRELVWRKTDNGATSAFCQHCDLQLYAKDGTEAERMIHAAIGATTPAPAPAAVPPLSAEDSNKQAPTPKPRGAFGLGAF